VVPAEEWVESSSDSEDAETSSQHPSSHVDFGGLGGGGGGTDEGGGGGGWLLDIGVAEDANPRFRASMEDAHIIRRKFGPPVVATAAAHRTHEHSGEAENKEALAGGGGGGSTLLYGSLFGVFDGHGGRATVDFLERHFPRALSRKLRTLREGCSSSEVSRALESTFLHVDAAMAPQETRERVYGTPFQDCGSTACVAYLRPNAAGTASRELFLANVGDAQAVIAVDKKELQRGNMASGSSGAGGAAAAAAASGTNKKSKRGSNSTANRAVSPTPRADGSSESLAPTERTPKKGGTHKKSASSRGGANNTSSSAKDSPLAKTLARGSSAQLASTARAVKLTAQSLSYAHVASDSKEVARIKAAGGCVFANRVGGCLAVSRAFGDYALKASGVSCVPYQQHVSLTPAHKFLILACDGLFDVMDAQTAVDTVASLRDAQQMADKLVALALKRGTTDNVSCMVVRLHE
jgi:protein phosphatase PTC1